jgi:DNA-binding NarL/FixJ family response regulator
VALRLLIVDDNAGFREAARCLLEKEGLEIVGTADSGDDAVGQAEALAPDAVLLDVKLGDESGFDVAPRLPQSMPVIFVSTHDDDEFCDLIDASPAVGFIAKTELSADRIHRVLAAAGAGSAAD